MRTLIFTIPCDCGGTQQHTLMDLTSDEDDPIDVDSALSQTDFWCPVCKATSSTGDLADIIFENEGRRDE